MLHLCVLFLSKSTSYKPGSIASEGLGCLADEGSRRRNLKSPSPFIPKTKGWTKAGLGGL